MFNFLEIQLKRCYASKTTTTATAEANTDVIVEPVELVLLSVPFPPAPPPAAEHLLDANLRLSAQVPSVQAVAEHLAHVVNLSTAVFAPFTFLLDVAL